MKRRRFDVGAAYATGVPEVPGRSAWAPPPRAVDRGGPVERRPSDVCHGRLSSLAETVTGSTAGDGLTAAAQVLHDFNLEYDEPAPPPDQLADRLRGTGRGRPRCGPARLSARDRRSCWGRGDARAAIAVDPGTGGLPGLTVIPRRLCQRYGRELITQALRVARAGADYAFLVTSEDDRLAQRPYQAAGFRRPEARGRKWSAHAGPGAREQ